MLKKYFVAIVILFLGYAQADEKKWFGELGWSALPSSIAGTYESKDTSNLNGVENKWEAMNKFYGEIGYTFLLENDSKLLTSVGVDFIMTSTPVSHATFFTKASLLYPVFVNGLAVNVGPKVKIIVPFSSSYEDKDDGIYTRKVEYDTNVAFALGIEAVWGEEDVQFVTGVEYLTSSNYKGSVTDNAGYANSTMNLNGVYLNLGVRFRF